MKDEQKWIECDICDKYLGNYEKAIKRGWFIGTIKNSITAPSVVCKECSESRSFHKKIIF